jgi:hypothetical protein
LLLKEGFVLEFMSVFLREPCSEKFLS